MAKLSNINGKFAVEDTGAIRFSDQTGTTGQILKSNGNSAPTWVDPNTVGTGPWLPLAGGVVSGATTFQSSLTVGGTLTVNGSGGSVFNSTGASNHIIAAYRASNGNNVATFRTTDSGYIFRIHAQNAGTIYVQNDDGSNYIKIPDSGSNEVSGNTTFAGTVLIDGLSNYTGLTVKGAGASRPAILFENVNQGSLGMIYATEGDAIVINTGSDAVTIDSSGNVGIGVTPFAHTLGTSASLDLKGFGGIWGYAGATYVNSNAYYDSGWKYKTTAPAAVLQVGGSSQELTFRQAVSGTAGNAITYTQPFTIDTSGKVGIGTTSPNAKLEIATTAATAKPPSLRISNAGHLTYFWDIWRDNTTGYLNIGSTTNGNDHGAHVTIKDQTGNVGIGTTSPSEKLSVVGGNIRLESTVAGSNGVLIIYDSNTTQSGQIYGSSGDLKIYSPADVLFNQGGNVGINATDPVKTLDVRGSLAISNSTASYWYIDRNDATGNFDLNENTNGTLFTVTPNGNVGIGTTAIPSDLYTASGGGWKVLQIGQSSQIAAYGTDDEIAICQNTYLNSSGVFQAITSNVAGSSIILVDGKIYFKNASTSGTAQTTSTRMFIDTTGNVGIGTTSPETQLSIGDYTDSTETITIATSSNGTGRINFYDNNNTEGGSIRVVGELGGSKMYFSNRWNTDNDRVVFDLKNGNVGIGTTTLGVISGACSTMTFGSTNNALSGGVMFQANGTNVNGTYWESNNMRYQNIGDFSHTFYKNNTTVLFTIATTGTVTAVGDVVAYSDKKLKKNIKTLDGSKVYEMRGVSFDRIDTNKASSGVIAQEIQQVAPELIDKSKDGTLGVAYGNLTGYLIEAIKELKAEIEELKSNKCNCKE